MHTHTHANSNAYAYTYTHAYAQPCIAHAHIAHACNCNESLTKMASVNTQLSPLIREKRAELRTLMQWYEHRSPLLPLESK
jgi:hypothetical protein